MTSAEEVLLYALETLKQRGQDYDLEHENERSMGKIVDVFNTITNRDLTEKEGYLFMLSLKLVRLGTSDKLDSAVDLAGYSALIGETLNDE
jgi:hypothetical protein